MLKRLVIHSFPVNPPLPILAKCSVVLNSVMTAILGSESAPTRHGLCLCWPLEILFVVQ